MICTFIHACLPFCYLNWKYQDSFLNKSNFSWHMTMPVVPFPCVTEIFVHQHIRHTRTAIWFSLIRKGISPRVLCLPLGQLAKVIFSPLFEQTTSIVYTSQLCILVVKILGQLIIICNKIWYDFSSFQSPVIKAKITIFVRIFQIRKNSFDLIA